jgi:hypothetical protein
MKKVIFVLICCSIVVTSVNSQVKLNCDSSALSKKYFQSAMYLKQGFWGVEYEKNGGTYSTGFFNSNLRSEFLENKVSYLALKELQKSTTNRVLSFVFGVGSIVPLLFINRNKSNSTNGVLSLIFLGALVISIPFSILGNNQRSRAIWLYNKDVMSRE